MRLALAGELGFMGRGEHSRLRLRQRCSSQEKQGKCRTAGIYLAGKAAWEEDGRLAGELRSDCKGLTCQAEEFRIDTISADRDGINLSKEHRLGGILPGSEGAHGRERHCSWSTWFINDFLKLLWSSLLVRTLSVQVVESHSNHLKQKGNLLVHRTGGGTVSA